MSVFSNRVVRLLDWIDRILTNRRNKRAILASGLFDEHWYLRAYPDVRAAGVSAIGHYIKFGTSERRIPGPLFDPNAYLQAYPDVREKDVNPLAHFASDGMGEGRVIQTIGGIVSANKFRTPLDVSMTFEVPGKLVVMVHAFYADVFDEICGFLAAFKGRFTLLVSVPDEAAKTAAEQAMKRHAITTETIVRVSENRGRNFAPLLCLFAKEILQHDVLLHLHTKKSLFTGQEKSDWRSDIYGCLVSNKFMVQTILAEFAKDEKLGVIYAATWSNMPYWAHHWLQNDSSRRVLAEKIGISLDDTRGFLNFPVGGMFWAKVDAVRPLLEAGLTYEDFPPELGQTDGTIAHAIERSINLVAARQGYAAAELDYELGVMRRGWSDFNQDQYLRKSMARFKSDVMHFTVVSFDVFDTLVFRPSLAPDSALKMIAQILAAGECRKIGFFERRKGAEAKARAHKNGIGDVDLSEIYAAFEVDDIWTLDDISNARIMETTVDAKLLQPRAPVIELLKFAKAANRRVIIASDTYYDRTFIEELLSDIGVREHVDAIYLSSEFQARKDRGDLFDLILDREKVLPSSLLHIGDNEVSDVQRPGDRGIVNFHVMNPTRLLANHGFMVDPAKGDFATDLVMGPILAKLVSDPFVRQSFGTLAVDHPADLGYVVFGPLVFAFTAWVLKQAVAGKVEHIAFFSREGYLLQRAYEVLRSAWQKGRAPSSEYFLVSRRAALMASQANGLDLDDVFQGDFQGRLSAFLKSRLGLPYADHVKDPLIRMPQDVGTVRECLTSRTAEIVDQGRQELAAFQTYLSKSGLADGSGRHAVVDVGYSATIQNALQKLAGRPFTGFYMATYENAQRVESNGGTATGYFANGAKSHDIHIPLIRHQLILEALLTAPHGQLLRFVTGDDATATPVLKFFNRKHALSETFDLLHEGVIKYIEDLLFFYGPDIIDLDPDRRLVQESLRNLGEGAIRVSPLVKQCLNVEDEYCGYKSHDVGANLATM